MIKVWFSNMTQTDLFDIIDSTNTKVIVYEDGEYREEVVRGDMDVFCKNLFEEEFSKKEIHFFIIILTYGILQVNMVLKYPKN